MKRILTLLAVAIPAMVFAQTNTPMVLSSGGNYHVNGTYSQSVTIGELAVKTLQSGDYSLAQGFQQPLSTPEVQGGEGNKRACLNDSVSFSVEATGGGTLNFQWRKNGEEIPGENDSIIIFNPVAFADSGFYDCVVSNAIGTMISDAAKLTVDTIPVVTFNLASQACINEEPLLLTGGLPEGGVYTVNEVQLAYFDPADAGLDQHEIIYTFTDSHGCSARASQLISVKDITETGLSRPEAICINGDALTLDQGVPSGGTYDGPGISGGILEPIAAGLGTHEITYIYTNADGCSDTATNTITVNDTTEVSFGTLDGVCYGFESFELTEGLPSGGTYTGPGVAAGQFDSRAADVGVHALRYEYTNTHGCVADAYSSIEVFAPPEIMLGEDIVKCENTAIALSPGAGFESYLWSTDETSTSISVTAEGNYAVWVRDANNCESTDDVNISFNMPYQDLEICVVTVSRGGKNLVVWEPVDDPGIVYYNVIKQVNARDNFEVIATIPAGESTVYIDEESDPSSHSDYYKLAVTDTCGNMSDYSLYHKTIHLTVTKDQFNRNSLSWDDAEIENNENAFPSYYIYRGSSYENLEEIDAVGSNLSQWTDPTVLDNKVYYFVAVKKLGSCNPQEVKKGLSEENYSMSVSNIFDIGTSIRDHGATTVGLSIFPNPANASATIAFSNDNKKPYTLLVHDASGKVVRRTENLTEDTYLLERDGLRDGLYMISIIGERIYHGQIMFHSGEIHFR